MASRWIKLHETGPNWHQSGSNCIRLARSVIKVDQTASGWPELTSRWVKLHLTVPNWHQIASTCIRLARTGIKVDQTAPDWHQIASDWSELASRWSKLHQTSPNSHPSGSNCIKLAQIASDRPELTSKRSVPLLAPCHGPSAVTALAGGMRTKS